MNTQEYVLPKAASPTLGLFGGDMYSPPVQGIDAGSSGLPASMPYGLLSSEKPADPPAERGYTPKLWRELDLLYRGGYAIQACAKDFLEVSVGERQDRWKERTKLASYIGYFGQIVGIYSASLFGQPVAVMPAADASDPTTPGTLPEPEVYEEFATNADLRGASFVEVLKCCSTTALVKGKALVGIDFPALPDGAEVASRADSERLGLDRPYCFEILPEELIDWEYDEVIRRRAELSVGQQKIGSVEFEVGRFSWAVLRRKVHRRAAPTAARSAEVEEFRVWMRGDDGVIRWALYRTAPLAEGQRRSPDELVRRVAEGDTSFTEIPLVEIRLPDTLWLGNIIGPLNAEHWRRRSSLLSAQQRSLLVIPTVKLGPEIGGVGAPMPAEVQQDPERGDDPRARYERQGYIVLGADDDLEFKSPPTEAFSLVNTELKELVDEIHRVSGRMAASISSTDTAVGRSGASKAIDRLDFVTVLLALGAIFRDAARRIYDVTSAARGEDVAWTVHGLDRFDVDVDRAAVLDEALQIGAVDIPSRTFRVEHATRLANQLLPGLAPETQAVIRQEIQDGISAEDAMRKLMAQKLKQGPSDPDADEDVDADTPEDAAGAKSQVTDGDDPKPARPPAAA